MITVDYSSAQLDIKLIYLLGNGSKVTLIKKITGYPYLEVLIVDNDIINI